MGGNRTLGVILDADCISHLAKSNLFGAFLLALRVPIHITDIVLEELKNYEHKKHRIYEGVSGLINGNSVIKVEINKMGMAVKKTMFEVKREVSGTDPGEASAIAVAIHQPGLVVASNDWASKIYCEAHDICILQTIDILRILKDSGKINDADLIEFHRKNPTIQLNVNAHVLSSKTQSLIPFLFKPA